MSDDILRYSAAYFGTAQRATPSAKRYLAGGDKPSGRRFANRPPISAYMMRRPIAGLGALDTPASPEVHPLLWVAGVAVLALSLAPGVIMHRENKRRSRRR